MVKKKAIDLSWFDLKNYAPLKEFNLEEWENRLGIRARLNYIISQNLQDKEKDEVNHFVTWIKNNPLKHYVYWDPEEDLNNDNNSSITLYDSFPFDSYTVKSTTIGFMKRLMKDERIKAWESDSNNENYLAMPIDLILQQNSEPGDMATTHVVVDLYGTDEQIMKDFAYWLENYRNEIGFSVPKKDFTEKQINEWISLNLLPYLDLTLITKAEGYSITQSKLGNVLFPDEIDIDSTERIRRTVKPKAEWILQQSILVSMQVQKFYKNLK